MASQAPISDAAVEPEADDNLQPGIPTDADGNQYIEVDVGRSFMASSTGNFDTQLLTVSLFDIRVLMNWTLTLRMVPQCTRKSPLRVRDPEIVDEDQTE